MSGQYCKKCEADWSSREKLSVCFICGGKLGNQKGEDWLISFWIKADGKPFMIPKTRSNTKFYYDMSKADAIIEAQQYCNRGGVPIFFKFEDQEDIR